MAAGEAVLRVRTVVLIAAAVNACMKCFQGLKSKSRGLPFAFVNAAIRKVGSAGIKV